MNSPVHQHEYVPASRLYLPWLESPPPTILEYLFARFPRMPRETWVDRVARGGVTLADGRVVTESTPYRHGETVLYRREVPDEPPAECSESVLFSDDHILVADKPHGMVVSPAGDHLERSLLVRLQRRTGIWTLAPMHRLDRETAGLVLFSVDASTRGAYHQMFPEGRVEKEYDAVARVGAPPSERRWDVRNRLATSTPWYRQEIVVGPVNAETLVELVETGAGYGLFFVRPRTGKQHQIRVHMASLGFPVVGDSLYPVERRRPVPDGPMQLVARLLAFTDPISGQHREFVSDRKVRWPWPAGDSPDPPESEGAPRSGPIP
jgi:tRNA pseudouridine32 synthase/23S rRNA pseudouridine746 synthase